MLSNSKVFFLKTDKQLNSFFTFLNLSDGMVAENNCEFLYNAS